LDTCVNGMPSNSEALISQLADRFRYELAPLATANIEQIFLQKINLICSDDHELAENEPIKSCKANLIITIDTTTGISVLTICVNQFQGAVSQLLDRVSRQELMIESQTNKHKENLENIFAEKYSAKLVSTPRVCLSTFNKPDSSLKPYLLANETFQSTNMNSSILEDRFSDEFGQNLAYYDLSEIYAGERTVFRQDDTQNKKSLSPTAASDAKLLFLLILILLRDASVGRANERIKKCIADNRFLSLHDMDSISEEFGSTMRFWDLRVFRYLTAQRLADDIADKFGIDKQFKSYQANQDFLQHRLNIDYSIKEQWQNELLFIIGVLVFFFEATPAIYSSIMYLLDPSKISQFQVFSAAGAFSSTILLILLFFIRRRRKARSKNA